MLTKPAQSVYSHSDMGNGCRLPSLVTASVCIVCAQKDKRPIINNRSDVYFSSRLDGIVMP